MTERRSEHEHDCVRGEPARALRLELSVAVIIVAATTTGTAASAEPKLGWYGSPPAALYSRIVFDSSRGRVVLAGGSEVTWELEGDKWTAGPPLPAELAWRQGHAMAFDAARGRTILFGGEGRRDQPSFYYGDTWEYDGRSWSSCGVDAVGPGPRSGATMAFDPRRRRIVLFGGVLVSSYALTYGNDTWEHDGAGWVQGPPPPAALAPRAAAAMAFDSVKERMVLFGGFKKGGGRHTDTWEYDGTEWIPGPAAPENLPSQLGYAMVTDANSGHAVMFGGYASLVWQYGDAGWTSRSSRATEPAGLPAFGLAYDSWRSRLVVLWPDAASSRTWESDGANWRDLRPAPPKRDDCGSTAPSVRGVVRDRAGKEVLSMPVVLEGTALLGGRRTAYTDPEGKYCFNDVPVGSYDIVVVAPLLYEVAERSDVEVHPGVTLVADFTLCPDGREWYERPPCGSFFSVAEGCSTFPVPDVEARVRRLVVEGPGRAGALDLDALSRLRALGPAAVPVVEQLLPSMPHGSSATGSRRARSPTDP